MTTPSSAEIKSLRDAAEKAYVSVQALVEFCNTSGMLPSMAARTPEGRAASEDTLTFCEMASPLLIKRILDTLEAQEHRLAIAKSALEKFTRPPHASVTDEEYVNDQCARQALAEMENAP